MKKLSLLPFLTIALAACGTDDGDDADTGTDTSTDTTTDEGTGEPDTGVDTTDEGSEPPPTEICDDAAAADEDGDGAANCDDTDCDDFPACVPPTEICDDAAAADEDGDGAANCDDTDCEGTAACTESLCEDGADNDGDGATDCDDTDCAATAGCCPDGTVPRGGACVPMHDGSFGPVSYIRSLQIPPSGTDAECCFDVNGDDRVDNGLSTLLSALVPLLGDTDIEATIAEAIADDSITLLMDWRTAPESYNFSIYLGTNDTDGDGEPDQDFSDREAGDGVFQINPESLDEYGGLIQFNNAAFADGIVTAGPGQFNLSIPIDTGDFSLPLDLTINDATIEAPIDGDFASVDIEADVDGELLPFGGVKLGGVVPLDQIFVLIEGLARDCTCAGFTADPILTYGDDGTAYNVACAQTPTGDCTGQGTICENLGLVCQFAPMLPSLGLADIDTNDNGVADSLSVGIRLSLVPATLADPPVVPEGSGE